MNFIEGDLVERVKMLPADPRLAEFHQHTGSSHEAHHSFFYHLTKELMPALSLEIGCAYGVTSAYMAAAAATYGGQVVGVDRGPDGRLELLSRLYPNFHFVQGDSRCVSPAVAQFGRIGVVWQDSSHLYSQSREEWNVYLPLLDNMEGEHKAVWVCDDLLIYYPEDVGTPGLWGYWIERPAIEKRVFWEPSAFRVGATIGIMVL
jgi:hypothetical protein